jgi:hypothetical protein
MRLFVKTLDETLWSDFEAYFEFAGKCSGCWCMNHRLPQGLDFEGEAAKLAMKELVESNRVFGVLAYVDGDSVPVGWAAIDRRKTLPGHDCIGTDITCGEKEWSLHCITSRRDYKNKGIENLLMLAAGEVAKKLKGESIEAYPEPGSRKELDFKTWNTFNGYEDSFLEAGYAKLEKGLGEVEKFFSVVKKDLHNELR